jgi:hypothetical protein
VKIQSLRIQLDHKNSWYDRIMTENMSQLRFRFQEELALKDSLYPVANFSLNYAVKAVKAQVGVFLYDAPGTPFLEKVASVGLSSKDETEWSSCEKISPLPLARAIRTQKYLEIESDGKTSLMAFPLRDLELACAGFSISFEPSQVLDAETREFLFWLSKLTEQAIFRSDGEGV